MEIILIVVIILLLAIIAFRFFAPKPLDWNAITFIMAFATGCFAVGVYYQKTEDNKTITDLSNSKHEVEKLKTVYQNCCQNKPTFEYVDSCTALVQRALDKKRKLGVIKSRMKNEPSKIATLRLDSLEVEDELYYLNEQSKKQKCQ